MAKILIAEDDPTLLTGMEEFLSIIGYQVRAVTSGQDALDAIAETPPDLILSDILMPGMTGLQLLEAVRARAGWADIPFLLISASDSREIEEQSVALENVSYLRKPFKSNKLLQVIAEMLEAQLVPAP